MPSYKVSQLKHNHFDYVLIVVAPAFAHKTSQQQHLYTVVLQRCARRAGMKGVVVPGWDAGERYVVNLAAGVTSVEGAALAEPVSWAFATAAPRVLAVFPAEESLDQPLETAVRVDFNTPMDPVATASAFSMAAVNGEPVPGALTWEDEARANARAILLNPRRATPNAGQRYL